MNEQVEAPNPTIALTLGELAACQRLASTHVTFSLTLACPLRCAHCIVGAGPEKVRTTMPIKIAERYAAQMCELADYGIKGVSFTGGEPLVAQRQLKVISEAAAVAGLETSVVTAAHWAGTPERARAVVARFGAIACWDVSYDAHHLPWVGLDLIRNAGNAIRAAGRNLNIRVTYSDPMTGGDEQVFRDLEALGDITCVAQKLRPVGRAHAGAGATKHGYNPWVKPCLTQGLVIRYDSSVAPCCLNLIESRAHPFDFGDPRQQSLVETHRRFATDPLLQLIRSLGFGQIRDWIEEEGLGHLHPDPAPEEACELCVRLMHHPRLAEVAKRRASAPSTLLRIAVIAQKVLGETRMLEELAWRYEAAREALSSLDGDSL